LPFEINTNFVAQGQKQQNLALSAFKFFMSFYYGSFSAFSALTLLVGRQEEHPASKN